MQIATAIKQLQNEADFLGMDLLETLQDIKRHGSLVYGKHTMQAFVVFMQLGQEMFETVDH